MEKALSCSNKGNIYLGLETVGRPLTNAITSRQEKGRHGRRVSRLIAIYKSF